MLTDDGLPPRIVAEKIKKERHGIEVSNLQPAMREAVHSQRRQPEFRCFENSCLRKPGTRPTWESAYFAAMLALNTTCRGCELKGIRWRDVNLLNQAVVIQQSKTAAGQRVIPLNRDAMQIIMAMRRRAEKLGETLPDHYVFFACENGNLDPSKPQKSWRTAWRNLTKKAGLPGLRFHDLRHHAITELAESQASDAVIMGIAGHVSKKMLEHYSHARLRAKRTALDAPSGAGAGSQGYDTSNGTKQETHATVQSERIENRV